ncbi:MAG TPA: hypothetical protein VLK36_08710 [Gaiellaceae bacterium]|nr:hypothetical protein [Gaiellaceae bacterium]
MKAAALSGGAGTVGLWPRLLVTQDALGASSPTVFCEYGDGSTGTAAATLTKQPKSGTPSYQAVPLNIGGSYDCPGGTGSGGDVASISLPVGHYNVAATLSFLPGTGRNFDPGD